MVSLGWAGLDPAQLWDENSSLGLSIPYTNLGQVSAHPNEAMNSINPLHLTGAAFWRLRVLATERPRQVSFGVRRLGEAGFTARATVAQEISLFTGESSMRALGMLLATVVFLSLISAGLGQDEKKATNKEKIVGVWELVNGVNDIPLKPGDTLEFTKDGKIKAKSGKDIGEGSYKLDGEILKFKQFDGPKEEFVYKIKTLTDKALVMDLYRDAKLEKMYTIEFKKK